MEQHPQILLQLQHICIQEDDNFLTDPLGTICATEIAEQPKHVTSFSWTDFIIKQTKKNHFLQSLIFSLRIEDTSKISMPSQLFPHDLWVIGYYQMSTRNNTQVDDLCNPMAVLCYTGAFCAEDDSVQAQRKQHSKRWLGRSLPVPTTPSKPCPPRLLLLFLHCGATLCSANPFSPEPHYLRQLGWRLLSFIHLGLRPEKLRSPIWALSCLQTGEQTQVHQVLGNQMLRVLNPYQNEHQC